MHVASKRDAKHLKRNAKKKRRLVKIGARAKHVGVKLTVNTKVLRDIVTKLLALCVLKTCTV